ncbi:galactokinase [Pleomorphovibrio marinus]|uniref:galactokinase n=1 Tax=Pleomorphovibrio marinus TaxID=2164132 RepID=UPI000E0C0844|nr:galactokinase [Pleomorphovibrio marinus]
MIPNQIRQQFSFRFQTEPAVIVRSPGRINLIGEHTDYNQGFVLPAAIDKAIYLGFKKNHTSKCSVYSLDYGQMEEFDLNELVPRNGGWINFIMGVAQQFKIGGLEIGGFDCVFGGDIPIGAGLSSSAALENGVGMGLSHLFDHSVSKNSLIEMSQRAEHEFAGVHCGIMDMFASMMGKKDLAIKLDCKTLEYTYFPLKLGEYQFLLLDSKVTHALGDSKYNTRRKECEAGVALIQSQFPDVKSLRDVEYSMLVEQRANFSPNVWDRCTYVVEENERLQLACECLEREDLKGFGQLMYASHDGLRHKYEVSCPELDFLVDFTRDKDYVLGARMMGGGFGGCTIHLLESGSAEHFLEIIGKEYKQTTGKELAAYPVRISDGTEIIA